MHKVHIKLELSHLSNEQTNWTYKLFRKLKTVHKNTLTQNNSNLLNTTDQQHENAITKCKHFNKMMLNMGCY